MTTTQQKQPASRGAPGPANCCAPECIAALPLLSPLPPLEWECWVAYDYCEEKAHAICQNELEALRFAMENREYMLKVKRIKPGDIREQLT